MRRVVSAPCPEASPPPDWAAYEALARRVLDHVRSSRIVAGLEAQLAAYELVELHYTGHGLFCEIGTPVHAPALSERGPVDCGCLSGVGDERLALVGALLFVNDDGRVDFLELHGNPDWPESVDDLNVDIRSKQRES